MKIRIVDGQHTVELEIVDEEVLLTVSRSEEADRGLGGSRVQLSPRKECAQPCNKSLADAERRRDEKIRDGADVAAEGAERDCGPGQEAEVEVQQENQADVNLKKIAGVGLWATSNSITEAAQLGYGNHTAIIVWLMTCDKVLDARRDNLSENLLIGYIKAKDDVIVRPNDWIVQYGSGSIHVYGDAYFQKNFTLYQGA